MLSMLQTSRSKPALDSLPDEIKQHIIELVASDGGVDVCSPPGGWLTAEEVRDELVSYRKRLCALSLTSFAWWSLVAPYYWHTLDLSARSNDAVRWFAAHVLERVAPHLRALIVKTAATPPFFDTKTSLLLYDDCEIDFPELSAELSEYASEEHETHLLDAYMAASAARGEARTLRPQHASARARSAVQQGHRHNLAAFVIRKSFNLVALACDHLRLEDAAEDLAATPSAQAPETKLGATHAAAGCRHAGIPEGLIKVIPNPNQLEELSFRLETTDNTPAELLADGLVSIAPACLRLAIESAQGILPSPRLARALGGLASLAHLELHCVDFVDSSFAHLDSTWPLQSLTLDRCPGVSLALIRELIQRHAVTLIQVKLVQCPQTAASIDPLTTCDKLSELVLLSPPTEREDFHALLAVFKNAPLKRVMIVGTPAFTPEDAVALLSRHSIEEFVIDVPWPPLRTDVDDTWRGREAVTRQEQSTNWPLLEDAAQENGVTVRDYFSRPPPSGSLPRDTDDE